MPSASACCPSTHRTSRGASRAPRSAHNNPPAPMTEIDTRVVNHVVHQGSTTPTSISTVGPFRLALLRQDVLTRLVGAQAQRADVTVFGRRHHVRPLVIVMADLAF